MIQADHVRHAHPNRDSPPAVLLRKSYREGGKVKSRTLANISEWPDAKIESLRRVLAGETLVPLAAERFEIGRALAQGHVVAVLGVVRRLGLDKALPNGPERRARLILDMIVARIIEPAPKLATARELSADRSGLGPTDPEPERRPAQGGAAGGVNAVQADDIGKAKVCYPSQLRRSRTSAWLSLPADGGVSFRPCEAATFTPSHPQPGA